MGLLRSTKVLNGKPRPNWILDLHRFLGGLAMIFTGVHVLAIISDSYVHFGLVEVLVPFTGSWHPGAVAWGIVGMYLLAAVEITSLVRNRMSKKVWHTLHLLSFPVFVLTSIHVLTAGTDRTTVPTLCRCSDVDAVAEQAATVGIGDRLVCAGADGGGDGHRGCVRGIDHDVGPATCGVIA